jgi:CBS domain-containing protein
MLEYKIDCVPVVSGDRLIGIVTSADMIVLLLTPLEPATTGLPFEFNLLTPSALRSLRSSVATVTAG